MRTPFRSRRSARSTPAPLLLAILAACAVAVACSGSAAAPAGAANGGEVPAASSGPVARAAGGGGGGGDQSGNGGATGSSGGGSGGSGGGGQLAVIDDTKIVRTGTLQLTVADVGTAVTSARNAVRALGGYIGGSQQERNGDETVASVTYRIPVSRWEDALDALRRLGTEVNEKTDATEVTGQVVDLAARIRNLKASETALVGYAQAAPKVSDLLEIEARLTDTRGEIERLTAQQAQLEDQAAMATLTATFGVEPVEVAATAARWDPGAEVDRAAATLIAVAQAVASFAIVFAIVWLPLLVSFALVGLIGLAVARRLGLRRTGGLPPFAPPTPPTPPTTA